MMRLGVLATHPIQYQAPLFRRLAERSDLTVYFAHRQTARDQARADFGVEFEWDVPLLEGYRYRFLDNRARHPDVSTFRGCDTPQITAVLREMSFDAFLLLGWYNTSFLQAIYGGRLTRTPLMVRSDSQLHTPRGLTRRLIKQAVHRYLLRQFDACLYVGVRSRSYYEHYGVAQDRLFAAPHFVDTEFFSRRAAVARLQRPHLRASLGIDDAQFALLFVGKLIERKRPMQLIDIAALAKEGGRDTVIIYVGSGPLEGEIRRHAHAAGVQIVMTGFKNQTELPDQYVAADMLVLPSDARETWGLVVNEAMACGTPAAVSEAVGCAPDLINKASGVRFPLDDVRRAAAAIENYVMHNPPDAIANAVAQVTALYTVDAAAAGIMNAANAMGRS